MHNDWDGPKDLFSLSPDGLAAVFGTCQYDHLVPWLLADFVICYTVLCFVRDCVI